MEQCVFEVAYCYDPVGRATLQHGVSEIKASLTYSNIDSRENIDLLECNLKALDSVQIDGLGLSSAELRYDQSVVSRQDLENAIQQAGGSLQSLNRLE